MVQSHWCYTQTPVTGLCPFRGRYRHSSSGYTFSGPLNAINSSSCLYNSASSSKKIQIHLELPMKKFSHLFAQEILSNSLQPLSLHWFVLCSAPLRTTFPRSVSICRASFSFTPDWLRAVVARSEGSKSKVEHTELLQWSHSRETWGKRWLWLLHSKQKSWLCTVYPNGGDSWQPAGSQQQWREKNQHRHSQPTSLVWHRILAYMWYPNDW